MSCPHCGEQDVTLENKKENYGSYEEEDYSCPSCGCEWTWKMTMEITKKGEEQDDEL